jgi:hypothetical protein
MHVACAVRARGAEAFEAEKYELVQGEDQVEIVNADVVDIHFVAVQLHRHCLSIFTVFLPWLDFGFHVENE